MKYVLDASIALKWVLPEPDSPQAIALRDAYRRQQHELHAPELFAVEVAYVLSKTFHRGVLTQAQATQSLHDVLQVSPVMHAAGPLVSRAFEISTRLRISLYDCLYVALAEREQCELVTADQRLLNALSPHFTSIVALAAVP